MKEFFKKNWWIFVAAEVLILGVLTFLCFHKDRTIVDAPLDKWDSWVIDYNGDSWYLDETIVKEKLGESKSVDMIYGPYIDMKKGSYTVTIQYEAYENHSCLLDASEGEDNHVYLKYSGVALNEGQNAKTIRMELTEDVDNFSVKVVYGGKGSLKILGITIVENKLHDIRVIVEVFFLFAFVDCLWIFRKKIKKHKNILCMLGGILFIVSLPEMISGFYDGHDMAFHLLRIEGIAQELKNGSFPARIHSLSLYGYGYPVSIFYGDILLYLPAMLRIVGVPVMSAYKVYILFINVLTMLISYFSFSKMFKNRNVAVLGTLIYVTSPYRMLDVYIRAAVGEYTAMMAYPLIALALYLIYTSDAADWKKYRENSLFLALGMSLLISSHVLSTEMTVFTLVVVCLVLWKKTLRKNTLRVYGLAVAETCLLCAYFIVPFLDYYINVDVKITDHVQNDVMKIQKFGAYVGEYFTFFRKVWGHASESMLGRMQITPGLILMGALILWVIMRLYGLKDKKCQFFAGASIAALFVASNLFPWDKIAAHTKIGLLLAQVQYSWRYVGIATVFLVMLACEMISLEKIQAKYSMKNISMVILVISVLMTSYLTGSIFDSVSTSTNVQTTSVMNTFDTDSISTKSIGTGEYLRTGSDIGNIQSNMYEKNDANVLNIVERKGNKITVYCENGEKNTNIELPIFNYKGYHATNDLGNELEISDGENNVISVAVPAGFAGNITVAFHEPVYWRIAELVSLISVIGVIVFAFRRVILPKRRQNV